MYLYQLADRLYASAASLLLYFLLLLLSDMDLPHPKRHRDSNAMTDLESVHFEAKQITGPEFYNRSNLSRRLGLVGLGVAALFGVGCICAGVIIPQSQNPNISGIVAVSLSNSWDREIFCLGLNLMVTACTEATGFVHGIALRSALASERRLRFNTNLRLLSAGSGVFNLNGTLCNIVMAILLIISYSSSSLLTLSFADYPNTSDGEFVISVGKVPLVVLGIALLLQAVIAYASVWSADILTWSSSPFDITAALVHHAQILPEPGRCMHGVADDKQQGPVKPSTKQSSAWGAHKGVRKVVITLWLLVATCVVWGVVIVCLVNSMYQTVGRWSFLPQAQSDPIAYPILVYGWFFCYVNMAAMQGLLTLALHCSELVVNVVRDERVWKKAATKKGMTISSHPLAFVFGSPLNVALLVSKPLLHWMFGLAISFTGYTLGLQVIWVEMWPIQILNYSAALFIFSLVLTVIVFLRPSGPQPATYGHIQTLANLIDEWSPTMWWGHKYPGHAGTSDVRLGEVDMNASYG